MTAREQIEKAYSNLAAGGCGFVKVIDIMNATDIPAGEFAEALREMNRSGWMVIENSIGGDVTDEERRYCPTIGAHQVHLIAR